MLKKITLGIACAIASMGVTQVSKDTVKLEEIIIKGNRIETVFSQTARDIQVLTAKEIEKMPISSLNELLTFVGGVDIQQRGPFGTQADVSMDGGTFEQTLILLNGVKLVNSQTAHNVLNLPIPLEAIEYIEIIHGPAARLYGINALTGAINIVTKKTHSSFVTASIYGGSSFQKQDKREGEGVYGGAGIDLTGNYGNEKQNHLFSISKKKYNGHHYNSGQDALQLFYDGNYKLKKNHDLQLFGGYSENEFGANGFYAAPGDSNAMESVKTALISLKTQHKFKNLTIHPSISNRYDEDDYRYLKDMPTIGRSMHYTNALMPELNMKLKTHFGSFGWGFDARFENINSTNIGVRNRENYGAYAEYKGVFWRKLIATTGVYANYNSAYDWQMYPGIDFAYLFDDNWKIATSIGSGQRIPSFTDLYLNQLPGNIGNPDLRPENAWQYDIGINYTAQNLQFKTGCFYRDVNNFIDWVREDITLPYSPLNFGNMLVHGINARVQQQFIIKEKHKISYFMSYNYLEPSYTVSGDKQSKYVLESLKHQLVTGFTYEINNFSGKITNRLIKRELNRIYNILDLHLDYQLRNINVFTSISNLLDNSYLEIGAVPMPGRWFRLGVKYTWLK